jgi:L-amino acid N-acyltransferase YncA
MEVATMSAVWIGLADGAHDLEGIMALQRANLEAALGPEAAAREGFVTLVHTREVLAAMHALCPSIVAKVGAEVVAYALVMPVECRAFVPLLEPMFAKLASLELASGDGPGPSSFYVMGQICIAPSHRGTGLFDALYAAHRTHFADRWELCVTDVATRNTRSLRAHERVGFERLATYTDATDTWALIGWWLRR